MFLLYHDSFCFIVIFDHTNIGVDTILSLLSLIVTKIKDLILFSFKGGTISLSLHIFLFYLLTIL